MPSLKAKYPCKGCEHRVHKREYETDLDMQSETHGKVIHENRAMYCKLKQRSCIEMERENGDTPCGDNPLHIEE